MTMEFNHRTNMEVCITLNGKTKIWQRGDRDFYTADLMWDLLQELAKKEHIIKSPSFPEGVTYLENL